MPQLSLHQYEIVYNTLSLVIATMLAAFIYFFASRKEISPKYRPAILISSIVVAVAGYHYFRIFNSWEESYVLSNGSYIASGKPFDTAYRYFDWLLTVPLLLTELFLVLGSTKDRKRGLLPKLILAAVLMIVLGYPGENTTDNTTRAIWGAISTIPFVYILAVLWTQVNALLPKQPAAAQGLVKNIRYLLLFTWGFYPITYMLPMFGFEPSNTLVSGQIAYSVGDILAKAFYGLMIHWIATVKSESENYVIH